MSNLWVPQCCANHYGRDCRGKSHTLIRPALSPAGRWHCWFSTPGIHECASLEKGGQNPRQGAPACRGCREQYPEVMTRSSLSLENILSLQRALAAGGSCQTCHSPLDVVSAIPWHLPSVPWAAFTSLGESAVSVGQESTDPAHQSRGSSQGGSCVKFAPLASIPKFSCHGMSPARSAQAAELSVVRARREQQHRAPGVGVWGKGQRDPPAQRPFVTRASLRCPICSVPRRAGGAVQQPWDLR